MHIEQNRQIHGWEQKWRKDKAIQSNLINIIFILSVMINMKVQKVHLYKMKPYIERWEILKIDSFAL